MITLDHLRRSSLRDLERLYVQPGSSGVPEGVFRGVHLSWIPETVARRRVWQALVWPGFKLLPYGVDFDRQRWFFLHAGLRIGRFAPRPGRSRWRDCDTVCLEYHDSRLPAPLRSILYDEVKPLSETLCLGLAGLDFPTGRGDMFFFGLERIG